jgi:signal transduction histidine kinase
VLALPQPSLAQDESQQRVLALYVTTPGAAGATAFETVYRERLTAALGARLDFHSEYIDLARFSAPEYQTELADFLRYKYAQLPPDVILATTERARQFVERFRTDLFPGVPIVFVDRTASARHGPGMTGVRANLDLSGTLDLALALQPATTRVLVVSGRSDFDRFYENLARQQLQRFESRVNLTYLPSPALAELERTVARLPANSIIYFLTLSEDGAGARFNSVDVRDRVSAAANVSMYSWHAVAMGRGIVGGRLFANEVVAERTAELALRILRGETPDSIPVVDVDANLTQVDWRELQRWNISETRVPPGATVMFRELTLWDRYKAYISGVLVLLFLQSALIAGLLVQRGRRRRTETALRENQAILQASHTQISDLFGRLIAAQETERTRIARDLHDDVSQRVAGLSMMISGVKRKLLAAPGTSDVLVALTSMQQNTIALAEEIRHVSHDLHPALLQNVGLVAALNVYCAEFETMHAIAVTYRADPDIGDVEAGSALCLYRITQEALRNVAKHAAARHVAVSLTRTAAGIALSIADDGKGFEPAGARGKGAGLGLVSIEERVRLLRGTVNVESQAEAGTRMRVQIPYPHDIPPAGDTAPRDVMLTSASESN